MPTADGHVILAIGNDGQFRRFCQVIGRGELADDPRFISNAERVGNREILITILLPIMKVRSSQDWIAVLEEAGVPCGPINSLDQVFADPQVKHRGMAVPLAHPLADDLNLVANPIRLSKTPVTYDRAPPLLGADTIGVLGELLGLGEEKLKQLAESGII
jgi:crotonobetainyl-CoA:carnitine CoA-transferase CaiB-like acyl-CoA transferase